jgi:hypothetical protein
MAAPPRWRVAAMRADKRLYVVIVDAARDWSASPPRCASSPATPLLRLPDWEVLPYDLFSPHGYRFGAAEDTL